MQIVNAHNYFVGTLKCVSILGIILILLSLYIWHNQKYEDLTEIEQISQSNIDTTKLLYEHQINVDNLLFEGVNEHLEPYQIFSTRASKTFDEKYLLSTVDLKYKINGNDIIANADHGLIDKTNMWVVLNNMVKVRFSDVILNTQEFHVDLQKQEIFSNVPVSVLLNSNIITADRFMTEHKNNIITFKGNVIAHISNVD